MKTIANKPLTKRLLKKAAMLWILTSFGYLSAESNAGVSKKMIPTFNLQEQMAASLSSSKDSTAAQVKTEEEVVVTALGIEKNRKALGYSTTSVKGDELTLAREVNLSSVLVGKVAGLNVDANATGVGGSTKITIRGNNSLTLGSQPLVVVNGIPFDNTNPGGAGKWGGIDLGDGMSSINPDDIESVNVLKGAAAAALYGQRARNGALVITTKAGKRNRPVSVDINSNTTFDAPIDFTDYQFEYGQGTAGQKPTTKADALATGASGWGAKLDGSPVIIFDGSTKPYSAQKNNITNFYNVGSTLSNSVSAYGGSQNADYFFSYGNVTNKGILPNSTYDRNSVALNVNLDINSKISSGVNINYVNESRGGISQLSDAPNNANFGIRTLPANISQEYLKPGYTGEGSTLLESQFSDNPYRTNPYFVINRNKNTSQKNRVFGAAFVKYQVLPEFSVKGRVTNDFYAFEAYNIYPAGITFRPLGALDNYNNTKFSEINAEFTANYKKKFDKIGVDVIAGANTLYRNSNIWNINAGDFSFFDVYNPATAATQRSNLSQPKSRINSLFASADINYDNFLFLTISNRSDWSSTLPKENNFFNYPAVSLGFDAAKLINSSMVNLLKLRAAYATVGGEAAPFQTQLAYSLGAPVSGTSIGAIPSTIPNINLKPLTISEMELGFETKLFNNRLNVDFAWYSKTTKDDIVNSTVSQTSGYSAAVQNIAEIKNQGVELLINGDVINTGKFKWNTGVNLAYNINEVVALAPGQTTLRAGEARTGRAFVENVVGKSINQIAVFDYKKDKNGKLILKDDGTPQAIDTVTYAGSGIHPFTGAWNNSVSYAGLTLSFLIDWKFGGYIYSSTDSRAIAAGFHKNTLTSRGGVNVLGVDDKGNAVSKQVRAQDYYDAIANISSLQVYDASFIKLRSVTLSYNIPFSGAAKKYIKSATVSFVARNLFYILRKTENIEPEANYNTLTVQGLEGAGLPTSRSFGFNIALKF